MPTNGDDGNGPNMDWRFLSMLNNVGDMRSRKSSSRKMKFITQDDLKVEIVGIDFPASQMD
jgi:hypothetical protein